MRTIIIQGSANPEGNTNKVIQGLQKKIEADVLYLTTKQILPFDYQFKNQSDDFNPTIHHILDNYSTLIFATPVYWYTMSGVLKNFLDRFTDGLLYEKTLGKKFENKRMAVISCGSSPDEIEAFFVPFQKSASYLKMEYLGNTHLWVENDTLTNKAHKRLEAFSYLLK